MKYNKQKRKANVSDKTKQEADTMAKSIKRPQQTKEQTRLIAQGIQKGIELYKKQQKEKNREIDKQRKKQQKQQLTTKKSQPDSLENIQLDIRYRTPIFMWFVWILSSAMVGFYFYRYGFNPAFWPEIESLLYALVH